MSVSASAAGGAIPKRKGQVAVRLAGEQGSGPVAGELSAEVVAEQGGAQAGDEEPRSWRSSSLSSVRGLNSRMPTPSICGKDRSRSCSILGRPPGRPRLVRRAGRGAGRGRRRRGWRCRAGCCRRCRRCAAEHRRTTRLSERVPRRQHRRRRPGPGSVHPHANPALDVQSSSGHGDTLPELVSTFSPARATSAPSSGQAPSSLPLGR